MAVTTPGRLLPAGTYRGHGYMVGPLAVRPEPPGEVAVTGSNVASPSPALALAGARRRFVPHQKLKLVLVGNPLERDRAGNAEVEAAFDAKGSWLQLADGLPLKQISTTPDLKWAAIGRGAQADSLAFFQSDGRTVEHFTITRVSHMMAFDCGEFEFDPE